MKWMKILFFLFIGYSGFAQIYQQHAIKVTGNYTHKSGMVFPENFGELIRTDVTALDAEKKHIRVGYEGPLRGNEIKLSVFIFPNDQAHLATLKNEFRNSVKEMSKSEIRDSTMITKAITFSRNAYTLRGLTGLNMNKQEGLTIFECGKWKFKIRMTTTQINDESWEKFHKEFLDGINPTMLVKDMPWHPDSYKLVFDGKILRDSTLLTCLMLGASSHAMWIKKNVGLSERKAGVPGLHLKGYWAAYTIIIETWRAKRSEDTNLKHKFLDELENIEESGFLNEFIMEQFQNNLIVADDVTLDVKKFQVWKNDNPINIDLKNTYYTIMYSK